VPLTRRELLEKSLTFGAVTFLSGLGPASLLDGSAAQTNLLAFTHVTVIDATGQPALRDRTVIVAGDRIQKIGPSNELKPPKSDKVIDASGKYMIPGLWDMHAHFRGGPALMPETWLSLFLANGVTGVRELGGDIVETVFQWRAEIANGTRLGPRILTSGPKVDGPKPMWPGSLAVTDPDSARAAIDKLKAMGADCVKIYSPDFPPDVFAALIDEARKQQLTVGGHLSFMTMTEREAISSGVKFLEHGALYVLGGCSKSEKQINDECRARRESKSPMKNAERMYRYAQTFDDDWTRELSTELVQHGVGITPTRIVLRQLVSAGRVDYSQHPQRRYVSSGLWQTWAPKDSRPIFSDEDVTKLDLVHEKTSTMIKLMQSGGVNLLAGSDSSSTNPFTFPGWSLHQELELFVASGLSPMEALQTATRTPARFLNELESNGTVETGKLANLVLLNLNPLEDIRNTQKVDSVVLKGKLLTRIDLDKLLQDVATKAAAASS
jgi:hypothetical protein